MKKSVFLIVTLFLVLTIFIGYNFYYSKRAKEKALIINSEYESFYNVDVLGTDLASVINKIENSNNKNNVEKDNLGNYIENENNSIKLDVKFLELEENIPFEKITKQGINQLVENFGGMQFRCTKIEYHPKTGNIRYMLFEQI